MEHDMEHEGSILAQRAGLKLNVDELADLHAAYQRTQAQLQALRRRLARTEEPVTTFSPRVSPPAGEH